MSNPSLNPNLDGQVTSQLPVRVLKNPYFVLRTPIGGFYLDQAFNELLVKSPVNGLSVFLADARRTAAAGGETKGGNLGEVTYVPRENLRPLRYINEGSLVEFTAAARDFYKAGLDSSAASIRLGFRLPDPTKEPDAYWVYGDRFAPRLLVLWGCEKESGSSLPLVGDGRSVVSELRAKAMSWTRLFREGVELSRQRDALRAYLAFPILSPEGKLTHVLRFKDGQYVREEVRVQNGASFQVRPLTRLSTSAIDRFKKVAAEFYQKAHSQNPGGALSYEQELRRGFRLPDPERRPDAYFVTGRPPSEQLLILCPLPTTKDAEEIAQLATDLKWAEEKARTPEEKERAREMRRKYEEDLAGHKLYQRYFYSQEECLPLIADPVLGLAAPPPRSSEDFAQLPLPDALPGSGGGPTEQTVAAKLRPIQWGRVVALVSTIVLVCLAGIIAPFVLWPKQLSLISAELCNDPVIDPDNLRNVIEVRFSNRLVINEAAGSKTDPVPFGQYFLRLNGDDIQLRTAQLNATNHKFLVLTLARPGAALAEDGRYTLHLEGAKDVWGNVLAPTNLPLEVVDRRAPVVTGKVMPASADEDNALQVEFDEPMDKSGAEDRGNYSIDGFSINSAHLEDDGRTVILKADHIFQSGANYQLALSGNLTDASHARNHLQPATINFTYALVPLRLKSVSAQESQIRVKVTFNRPFDLSSAQSAIKLDRVQVGAVEELDDRSVELELTNSYMTNGSYTLMISGLKDPTGAAETALTTNFSFTYEGPIDTSPPVLLAGGLSAAAKRLELPFSKDLREASASREDNYTLSVLNGGEWQKINTRFRPELLAGSSSVVVLNLRDRLPNGRIRIQYSGVQDLAGNSTNGMQEFTTGINMSIVCRKGPQIMNHDRTMIKFALSGRIDKFCEKPENFQLEDPQGEIIPGIFIQNVTLTPRAGITEVRLQLNKGLPIDKFQVHYFKLRLAGEAWEQGGIARTAQ